MTSSTKKHLANIISEKLNKASSVAASKALFLKKYLVNGAEILDQGVDYVVIHDFDNLQWVTFTDGVTWVVGVSSEEELWAMTKEYIDDVAGY